MMSMLSCALIASGLAAVAVTVRYGYGDGSMFCRRGRTLMGVGVLIIFSCAAIVLARNVAHVTGHGTQGGVDAAAHPIDLLNPCARESPTRSAD
jgi:hypothetical protein